MSGKTLTFTQESLAEALGNVRGIHEMSVELTAEAVFQQQACTTCNGDGTFPFDSPCPDCQPQACQHLPISTEFGTWCELCEQKLDDAPQASAAQSAPAGEREAFTQADVTHEMLDAFKVSVNAHDRMGVNYDERTRIALAAAMSAWQRTQLAGVPDDLQIVMQQRDHYAARVETLELGLLRIADDYQPSTDAEAPLALAEMREAIRGLVLAAAPAQPAAQVEFGDAYQGAREDLAIWKRRALEAEDSVRELEARIDTLILDCQGESRMGEPVIPTAHDQGEVQRLREALEIAENCLHYNTPPETKELIRAAIAASTGQEV